MGIGIWNIKICNSLSNNDQCNEKRLCICEISQFSHKAIIWLSQGRLTKPPFVHGSYGQHGLFREKTKKIRPIREIRVQRILIADLEKTMKAIKRLLEIDGKLKYDKYAL